MLHNRVTTFIMFTAIVYNQLIRFKEFLTRIFFMFKIYRLRFPFLWISILLLLVFLDKVFLHSLFSTHHITQENEANSLAKRIDQGDQEDVMIHQQFFNYLKENLRDTPFAGSINYTRYQVARLGLLSLTNVTPLIPEFGPVYNDVTSFKYPILIEPCTIFQNTTSNSLFVAIISAPSYFPKRSSIRQTWLGQLKNVSSLNLSGYAFIVGKTEDKNVQTRIEEESRLFGDILQVGMIDTYNQLSIKAVGLINWLHNHCSGVDFVLKVDDDVYVNPRNLVAVANALNRSELSLYGKKTLSKTQRGPSKWQTNFDEWPWKKYPPYVFGATVIIPGTAIKLLLAAAQTVPYFRFEDTFLLALCSNKANIQIRGNDRILEPYPPAFPDPCFVYKTMAWLTNSVNRLNSFHIATEDFYRNVTHCVMEVSRGVEKTINPLDPFPFFT